MKIPHFFHLARVSHTEDQQTEPMGSGVSSRLASRTKGSADLTRVSSFSNTHEGATQLSFPYVVVGGGNAAGYFVDAMISKGVSGKDVAIITKEPYAPYERPALSKGFLMGKASLPGFHTCVGGGGERHDPTWYQEQGVTLMLGNEVETGDMDKKVVVTDTGVTVTATDALILATGASPIRLTRNPGHDLKGIHYLRDVEDGTRLLAAIKSAKHCVVVGGGYIGMECTAAMVSQGIKVTMVFPETHLMQRLFTPEMASFYEKYYEAKGVTLIKGPLCTEFIGNDEGAVTGCKLNNDDIISCDLVVVGVGARPNVSLVEGQLELAADGGVKVGPCFEASVAGVYAIGDMASYPLVKYDRTQRTEHVTHARQSSRHLANVLATKDTTPYHYLPHFYSRVFDLSWMFWGDATGQVVVTGDMSPQLSGVWVEDTGKVMGCFIESGSAEDHSVLIQAATQQPVVDQDALRGAESAEQVVALLASACGGET